MKILFYVKRGLYECIKIYFNINFLYNHPKASKRPLIAVPIIMNNPVLVRFGGFRTLYGNPKSYKGQNWMIHLEQEIQMLGARPHKILVLTEIDRTF